jgi:Zn-dependent protease with chaperone function
MAEDWSGISLLLCLLAVVPAAFSAWRSRILIRAADDPALPERLVAEQQKNGQITGLVFVVLAVASPRALWWTLPLLFGARVAAGYPLRRTLFEETWSLPGYLWFVARLTIAVWGFWISVALLPFAPRLAGRFDWLAAAAMALVLVVWNARYGDILRYLLRARPLENPSLLRTFTGLADACGLPTPRFEQVNLGGGVIANAIALPDLRRSSVVFTDALLSRLDESESAAICAHELAHLEYYTPPLLRRLSAATCGIIALGALLAVLPRLNGLTSMLFTAFVWASSFLALTIWRAKDRQRQETVCDQRAVALCGDVETVARALTKIHATARLPRRFDSEVEQRATHPSLARRLRDIRAAAGAAPVTLTEPATVVSADGKIAVSFAQERLQWTEGAAASHTLAYEYLSELRLHAKVKGHASLVAVERAGRRWETTIADADVGRVQAILDVVDAHLANPSPRPGVWPQLLKALLAFAAILGLAVGQLAMAIVAAIAAALPAPPLLAGAGAAALAAAGLSLRTTDLLTGELQFTVAFVLAVFGIVLLCSAQAKRDDDIPARTRLALVGLGFFSVLGVAALLMNGMDPVNLHQSALAFPSAAVFLFALAGTLALWPWRPARRASIPASVLGAFGIVAGSTVFLDSFGRDPFLGNAAPVTWQTIDAEPWHESDVPFYATAVRLSPGGRSVLVMSAGSGERYETGVFVGRAGSELASLHASEAVFVDDDRMLAVDIHDEHADVREVHVDDPDRAVWERRISGIANPVLSYRSAARRWQLIGVDNRGGIVRVAAALGEGNVDTTRWAPSPDRTRWPQVIAASGNQALVVETRYPVFDDPRLGLIFSLMQGLRMESRLSRVDAAGHTELATTRFLAQCLASLVPDESLTCSVFDGTRTRFAALDAATSSVTAMTWLPGRFAGTAISDDGWMSGWLGSEAVAVRPSTREGLRLTEGRGRAAQLVAHGSTLAAISYGEHGSMLSLYRLHSDHLRAAGR